MESDRVPSLELAGLSPHWAQKAPLLLLAVLAHTSLFTPPPQDILVVSSLGW